jgi:hypothetical protein
VLPFISGGDVTAAQPNVEVLVGLQVRVKAFIFSDINRVCVGDRRQRGAALQRPSALGGGNRRDVLRSVT